MRVRVRHTPMKKLSQLDGRSVSGQSSAQRAASPASAYLWQQHGPGRKYGAPVGGWQQQLVFRIGFSAVRNATRSGAEGQKTSCERTELCRWLEAEVSAECMLCAAGCMLGAAGLERT